LSQKQHLTNPAVYSTKQNVLGLVLVMPHNPEEKIQNMGILREQMLHKQQFNGKYLYQHRKIPVIHCRLANKERKRPVISSE
jgi:3-polyprenyl-4-hydroxybenzoate decarboxylase